MQFTWPAEKTARLRGRRAVASNNVSLASYDSTSLYKYSPATAVPPTRKKVQDHHKRVIRPDTHVKQRSHTSGKTSLTSDVLSISHNFGGGTNTYVQALSALYGVEEMSIIDQTHFEFVDGNLKQKCSLENLADCLISSPPKTILINHLLIRLPDGTHVIYERLFEQITIKCKYEKIICIIHDYYLLFPDNPNPVMLENLTNVPDRKRLAFIHKVFGKCDMIVFNSHNCFKNYNKFVNMSKYKYIITNTTPDILTNNYNVFPPKKPVYTIGIIGHIDAKHKGLHLLQKINQIPQLSRHVFKVFGAGATSLPHRNFYKSNVRLFGEYNHDNIYQFIEQEKIDCFMFVSVFEETWSYTLSIAMQTGLPIIYNDIGSYRERLYGRDNAFPFTEATLHTLPSILQNLNSHHVSSSNYSAPKSMQFFNHNADFNWLINDNANLKFDTSLIEHYLQHRNVCFFHFTNIGNGYEIFLEQIEHIKRSGLYDKLDFIFIVMLGPHIKLNNDPKFKVIYYSPNNLEWEVPSIKLIKSFSDNVSKRINILYIHTKGTLNKPHSKEWREYLQHFLVSRHTDCLHYLNEGRNCVGVNMNLHPKGGVNARRCHFSGNFWWSNTDYIKSLSPELHEADGRYATEHFIIGKYHEQPCGIVSLHNTEKNLYETPILPTAYDYSVIKNAVLEEYKHFDISKYKKTVCVYFIGGILVNAESRFFAQIKEMVDSGFYDGCHEILAFVSGHNDNIISKLSSMSKVKIIQTKQNEMEKFSLNNYRSYVDLNTCNIVYLHTKGASWSLDNGPINDWCNICNYFTISMWKINVILLQYYSCTGINLMSYPAPHFSGNFWWATGEHLSHLKSNVGDRYLDPEMYLLNNIKCKNKTDKQYQSNPLCLYKSIGNHAGARYDESLYKGLSVEDILDRIPTNYTYNNIGDNTSVNIDRITPIV